MSPFARCSCTPPPPPSATHRAPIHSTSRTPGFTQNHSVLAPPSCDARPRCPPTRHAAHAIVDGRRLAVALPGRLLALLKYPFYYMIRSHFGKFFGMIHVLCHLAPELDHFRFCPGFLRMLHFDRNWDIFGDVLTHGYNWAKMRNKRKNQQAKDGTERGQKRPRPAGVDVTP